MSPIVSFVSHETAKAVTTGFLVFILAVLRWPAKSFAANAAGYRASRRLNANTMRPWK
jgi:hypothetical protein